MTSYAGAQTLCRFVGRQEHSVREVALAVLLAGLMISATILYAASQLPRYSIHETSGGFDRLDVRSGRVEHCGPRLDLAGDECWEAEKGQVTRR